MKLARLGAHRTPAPENCLRHDGKVEAITGIEGDYDGEQMPLAEAINRLEGADAASLAYSSPSNAPGKLRSRILLPTSKELPPTDRAALVSRANGVVGGVLSRESWGLSRSFYYGSVIGAPFELHVGASERCIDEADELGIGMPFQPAPGHPRPGVKGKARPDYSTLSEAELIELIETGAHYFG